MAKRYHQTKEDRMHESRGMKKHEEHHKKMGEHREEMHEEHYAGEKMRRKHEMADWGMIHEDRTAVANVPQEVMYHSYPKDRFDLDGDLDDTLRGIDEQMGEDHSQMMRYNSPRKF